MVLDKFHVLQRRARSVGQRHAIPGLDVGIGGKRKNASAPSGAEDYGTSGDRLDLSGYQFDRHDALNPAVVHEQPSHEPLVIAGNRIVFERGLKQSVQHVEAGLVGGEPRAHLLHAAESAHGDVSIRIAAPGAAPVFQPEQFLGRLLDENLDGVLIAQPIAARDRVVSMLVESVPRLDDTSSASLGRNRMAAHGIDLRDNCHAEFGTDLGNSDSRSEACPASTDEQNVVVCNVHGSWRLDILSANIATERKPRRLY